MPGVHLHVYPQVDTEQMARRSLHIGLPTRWESHETVLSELRNRRSLGLCTTPTPVPAPLPEDRKSPPPPSRSTHRACTLPRYRRTPYSSSIQDHCMPTDLVLPRPSFKAIGRHDSRPSRTIAYGSRAPPSFDQRSKVAILLVHPGPSHVDLLLPHR